MLLIFDGPDACGKSTLCHRFSKYAQQFGYKVHTIHHTYVHPPAAMLKVYEDSLDKAEQLISQGGNIVLFDRFWPSEICYAQIYRDGSKLRPMFWRLDRRVKNLSGVYVWVNAETPQKAAEYHRKAHKTGRELYAPDERILRVAEWFDKLGKVEQLSEKEYGFLTKVELWRQLRLTPRVQNTKEICKRLLDEAVNGNFLEKIYEKPKKGKK